MNLYLEDSAKQFESQIAFVCNQINLHLVYQPEEADFCVSADSCVEGLRVIKEGRNVQILHSRPCEFFRALLLLLKAKDKDLDVTEKAQFAMTGVMVDNSRNAVMTIEQTKCLIAYAALMGMDHIQLYVEDTFEVQGQSYFGYMRMRYTQEEIKELNAFANGFGILLIPCIQTLAHLNQMLQWDCYNDIKDIDDILLVGADRTYDVIEDIIRSWRGCVDSKIIHIGMDEALHLGRGQYADKIGFVPRYDIMCSHLRRVIEICRKYDFKPIMWSDMFFSMLYSSYYAEGDIAPELLAKVPKDVKLTYWDYYTLDADGYDRQMRKHKVFSNELCFAGGAWKWNGFLPVIDHSMEISKYALAKAKEHGISMVMATAWGDDGAECPIYSVLPVLALFGEVSYNDEEDIDARVSETTELLTGYSLEDYRQLTVPNGLQYAERKDYSNNPTKYLLYQDILMGLFDMHVGQCNKQHFAECAASLQQLADRQGKMAYLFETAALLCRVLELKCDMGIRLKAAYDANANESMWHIAEVEIPELMNRLTAFHAAFKKQWYTVYKRGGFDVQDIRLGGLMARIQTAREVVLDYLNGEIDRIEELEQERLPFVSEGSKSKNIYYNSWLRMVTANKL